LALLLLTVVVAEQDTTAATQALAGQVAAPDNTQAGLVALILKDQVTKALAAAALDTGQVEALIVAVQAPMEAVAAVALAAAVKVAHKVTAVLA
jgi:hypothetical protein